MTRVILSPRATDDLEGILHHIAVDNPRRAGLFVRELRQRCLSLGHLPRRRPLKPAFGDGGRRAIHRDYLLFYSIQTDHILIEHVVHGSREAWRRDA